MNRDRVKECGSRQTGSRTLCESRTGFNIHAEVLDPNGTQPQEKWKTGRGHGGFSSCAASALDLIERTSADSIPIGRTLESLDRRPEALETYR
jgi:hypothetical protein